MTNYERMEAGLVYDCENEDVLSVQRGFANHLKEYNALGLGDEKKMQEMLPEMFAEVGEGCFIQPPFYANWGGSNVHLGSHIYANFSLTLVDDGHIFIGDDTMIAPNVTIATAGHPINVKLRKRGLQYNADVHIGKNVWIGAGAIILPGVTIGDNTVIGAGSVVTKDIPSNVVAVGNPCRVLREVGVHDDEYYFRDKKVDWDNINKLYYEED